MVVMNNNLSTLKQVLVQLLTKFNRIHTQITFTIF